MAHDLPPPLAAEGGPGEPDAEPRDPGADPVALEKLLHRRFGFPAFRDGQLPIVSHVASGRDALVVMPTGAGKSLCYQLPALARGGTTLVVSPLLALMKDQVDALQAKGVRATFINSTLTPDQRRERVEQMQAGAFELVYVAPERFTPRFIDQARRTDIRLLAIDEAHCLSQWGHDFRPDYLRLGQVRQALGHPPTVALTATATPPVQDDILAVLGIDRARRFVQGFDRPNLDLELVECDRAADKLQRLPDLLRRTPALVYCATRKNVERVTTALREQGLPAAMYHGGMDHPDRIRVQDDFMAGRSPVVVATNAFGMGVDKDDVRTIVHYDIPGTVEAYYQEIGRAGRDGKPARAILLFREEDRRTQEFFIRMSHPPAAWVHAVYRRLVEQRTDPVWITLEELAEALPDDAGGPRTAASCLYLLQREGHVRRIAPRDRDGQLTVRTDHPSVEPGGARGQVWQWILRQLGQDPYGDSSINPVMAADELGLERDQLTAALRGLEERGYLFWQAPDRAGGVKLLQPDVPLDLDETAMHDRRRREHDKLEAMLGYARAGCRRRYLIRHFGEQPPWPRCGQCDGCRKGLPLLAEPERLSADQQLVVRKLLACMARMGKPFSASMIGKVATGSKDRAVRAFEFDKLSTWGILRGWSTRQVDELLDALMRAGAIDPIYVSREVNGHKRDFKELALSTLGVSVMKDEAPDFAMVFPARTGVVARSKPRAGGSPVFDGDVDADLLEELRAVRTRLARDHDVPAYVVAPNRTIEQIAADRPTTRQAMLAVHGMGKERYRRYGQALLDAVRGWTGC
ncbi:MAG: ATP-dependent DNA helicase RecQ [Alphaproteobacteria bacterium]|nr:ATP-dependent DNA helicase RecQ [Alphaproteobacteria bacterium]